MIQQARKTAVLLFLLTAGALLTGCVPVFPNDTLNRVDKHVSFKELQADPEKFKGAWLMLAGVVISSKNTKEGMAIVVLQKPMDGDGRPLDTDMTEGRFLIQTDQFLDSTV